MHINLINEIWGRILREGRYHDVVVSLKNEDSIAGQFGLVGWEDKKGNDIPCVIMTKVDGNRTVYVDPAAILAIHVDSESFKR